jgi:type VI secretion system protein ImpL
MSAFTYEIAAVVAAALRANPTHPEGGYAVPWYLVVGNPGAGRTTALQGMGLTWVDGCAPLRIGIPEQLCTSWVSQEAVFIEPELSVLGPNRDPEKLRRLCEELRVARPREPFDGILLVLSIADLIDLDEGAVERYANTHRRYLVEIGQAVRADVPCYVVITRFDAVWGFDEVFQWTPQRAREEPWGFTLPLDAEGRGSRDEVRGQLDGLHARLEAFCISRLCSEDPPEQRIRAFQHLAEVRVLATKLNAAFSIMAMANAFERAPWFRALALGCALPRVGGGRLRAGMARFSNMGLTMPPVRLTCQRPGGLPLHAFFRTVILPERNVVPLRTRWRDDPFFLVCAIAATILWVATVISALTFAFVVPTHRVPGLKGPTSAPR